MDILLENSTTEEIPRLLKEMVKKTTTECKIFDSLQKDFLYFLIVVSMLENGFVLTDNDLEIIELAESFNTELLSGWKSRIGTYEALFVLIGFKTVVKVLVSPLGATVLVNLVIPELNSETYSVCIPVSRYVVSPQAKSVPMIFRNLKQFSNILKNSVVSPAKSSILNYHGYPSASLLGLPEEVLVKILRHLPIVDILHLGETCSKMKSLLDSESLWHCLCKRDFGCDVSTDLNSWKEMYRHEHTLELNRRTSQLNRPIQELRHYSNSIYSIHNPMWNII